MRYTSYFTVIKIHFVKPTNLFDIFFYPIHYEIQIALSRICQIQACWIKKMHFKNDCTNCHCAYVINYAFICEQLSISFSMRFNIHISSGFKNLNMSPTRGKNYSSTACISYLVYINAIWHNYRAFLEPSSALLHSGAIMRPQTMITCSRSQWKTSLCHLYSMEPIYQSVWDWQRTLASKRRKKSLYSVLCHKMSLFETAFFTICASSVYNSEVMASQTPLTVFHFNSTYHCRKHSSLSYF